MIASPTAIKRDSFKKQYEQLQEEVSAINTKLSCSSGAEAIRLQREAEETYGKMERIYNQLRQLEKQLEAESQPQPTSISKSSQSASQLLFDLLLQIDFKQQSQLAKEAVDLHRVSGFVVHGSPDCGGQQFLVTRLCRLNRRFRKISPIKIDVAHNGIGASIPHLWRHLAPSLGLPRTANADQIIEAICDRLQTQDVIFIFYTVDYMPPEKLKEWLRQFWEQLVMKIKATPSLLAKEKHLLMFLVDNSGRVCQSDLLLATQHNQPDYPKAPMTLPPICPFPSDTLEEWLDNSPSPIAEMLNDLTVETLLEQTDNGIPERVYEEICFYCNHDWEGDLAQWLV